MFQGDRSTLGQARHRGGEEEGSVEERVTHGGSVEPRCAPAEKSREAGWGRAVAELGCSAAALGRPQKAGKEY